MHRVASDALNERERECCHISCVITECLEETTCRTIGMRRPCGVIETAHCFIRVVFRRCGNLAPTLEPISGEAGLLYACHAYRHSWQALTPAPFPLLHQIYTASSIQSANYHKNYARQTHPVQPTNQPINNRSTNQKPKPPPKKLSNPIRMRATLH